MTPDGRPPVSRARSPRWVPGLAFHALTPLYDRALRLMFDEVALKRRLVEQAAPGRGHRVLDLGCGTGTLLRLLAERQPRCRLIGIDADPAMARRALLKTGRADANVAVGFAQTLPFAAASFDCVLSTLFLHHLPSAVKPVALREALRVMRPAADLHVMDFGRPSGWATWAVFGVLRVFDGYDNTAANARGDVPGLLRAAGFEDVRELGSVDTAVGTVAYLRARRP